MLEPQKKCEPNFFRFDLFLTFHCIYLKKNSQNYFLSFCLLTIINKTLQVFFPRFSLDLFVFLVFVCIQQMMYSLCGSHIFLLCLQSRPPRLKEYFTILLTYTHSRITAYILPSMHTYVRIWFTHEMYTE